MNGKITIGRVSSNMRGDYIMIELTDEKSHTRFLELEIEPEIFALVITGLSHQPCTFELRAEHVGKTVETKTELIQFEASRMTIEAAIKPYEVDGWVGFRGDLKNHNRRVRGKRNVYSVTFRRYV